MKKVILQDGSEMEVYEEADVNAAKTEAQKEAETLKQTVATLTAEKEALMADDGNRNWQKIRDINKKLSDAVKAQGKQVDENGNITEAPQVLTSEQIEQKASQAARRELLSDYKKKALAKYDDEMKKVVDHYYNKLTTGEEVTLDNVDKFIAEAARLATPESNNTRTGSFQGKPPVIAPQNGNGFANTEAGQAIAEDIFGADSFTKKK